MIRQQQKQQEESLDSKIETERKQALQALQKKREEEWARSREYAKSILNQIHCNEEKRLQQMKIMQKVMLLYALLPRVILLLSTGMEPIIHGLEISVDKSSILS